MLGLLGTPPRSDCGKFLSGLVCILSTHDGADGGTPVNCAHH